MTEDNNYEDEEEVEPHFIVSQESELYIVFDAEIKSYQAYLQLYNSTFETCFVVPLSRCGTDPIKLGQIVHNELRTILPNLDSQFMEVDEAQEITIHDSIKSSEMDSFDGNPMIGLKERVENNQVFLVLGLETLQ